MNNKRTHGESMSIFVMVIIATVTLALFLYAQRVEGAETIQKYDGKFLITAYCACEKCCGKKESHPDYGRMASGKIVYNGAIACNILPFGTEVYIEGLGVYTVEDRGCHSMFDNKQHIDIYMDDHNTALRFGRKILNVTVFSEEVF